MAESMDEILSNDPPETQPTPEPAPEVTQAAPEVKEPEAPAEPKAEKPKAEEMTEKERAFLAKANDEKQKRQELERRLAALESQRQPAAPAAEPQGFWDDPEGNITKLKNEIQAVAFNTKLETAEAIARSRHPDFDDNLQVFLELAQKTPGLREQALAQRDPAEFVYQTGKGHKELREAGSVDALRAKMEKEIRAQVEQEIKLKAELEAKEKAAIPTSLSEARSVGTNRTVWNGPESMDSILGR